MVDGLLIFLLTRQGIKIKEGLAGIDIINIKLIDIIILNSTILMDLCPNIIIRESQIPFIPGNGVHLQKSLDHTAVYIIPSGLLACTDHLNVPYRRIGGAFLHQFLNILINFFHTFPKLL